MRISISVTNYDGADLRGIARAADKAGVDTLWVTDHLIQADPPADPHRRRR
jgi:alkanesulfonate monooxygenase SsuD/methylene tetrahydromethanopterin reductase-like flavin-dependent oxidoreductase (luciferase family)